MTFKAIRLAGHTVGGLGLDPKSSTKSQGTETSGTADAHQTQQNNTQASFANAEALGKLASPRASDRVAKTFNDQVVLDTKKTVVDGGKTLTINTVQTDLEGNTKTSSETRTGGSRAWRNNNPGNLRQTSFTEQQGSIGSAGGFAVFPDEATGEKALVALLKTKTYQSLSIDDAVNRYAPPSENNTGGYQSQLKKATGLEGTTLLNTLSDEQLSSVAKGIRGIEGWIPGTVTVTESEQKVQAQ